MDTQGHRSRRLFTPCQVGRVEDIAGGHSGSPQFERHRLGHDHVERNARGRARGDRVLLHSEVSRRQLGQWRRQGVGIGWPRSGWRSSPSASETTTRDWALALTERADAAFSIRGRLCKSGLSTPKQAQLRALLLLGGRPRALRRAYRWPACEKPSKVVLGRSAIGDVEPVAGKVRGMRWSCMHPIAMAAIRRPHARIPRPALSGWDTIAVTVACNFDRARLGW
jgi:hypothetical protein